MRRPLTGPAAEFAKRVKQALILKDIREHERREKEKEEVSEVKEDNLND